MVATSFAKPRYVWGDGGAEQPALGPTHNLFAWLHGAAEPERGVPALYVGAVPRAGSQCCSTFPSPRNCSVSDLSASSRSTVRTHSEDHCAHHQHRTLAPAPMGPLGNADNCRGAKLPSAGDQDLTGAGTRLLFLARAAVVRDPGFVK